MSKKILSMQKRILKDPVKEYSVLYPTSDEDQIANLNELWDKYIVLKKELKNSKNQTRLLSKSIGEAKNANQPINGIKEKIKEQSSTTKSIASSLNMISEQIFTIFNLHEFQEKEDEPTISHFRERHYSHGIHNQDDFSISLLVSEHKEWNDYVNKNPAASIYHRSEWSKLIKDTFGHQSYYFFAKDKNGNFIGILPLIRLKSFMFGDFLISMPYFNYGGALADSPLIEQSLIKTANQQATKLGVQHIEYRDYIPRPDLNARTDKVCMVLSLPDEEEQLWNEFSAKLRSQIKRAVRESPEIASGGVELLNDFYAVFARNMRDLGTPVYGKSFFKNILKQFPDNSNIIIIKLMHKPVAAAFLVGFGDTLEIPWASTIRDVNKLSMNMFLYWEVLRFAIKNNFKYFDFGRSSKNSGTFRFKRQWGAVPQQLYWHYWLQEGHEMPSLNPDNPKFALLIAAWKKLPVTLSKLIGPGIVKYLP